MVSRRNFIKMGLAGAAAVAVGGGGYLLLTGGGVTPWQDILAELQDELKEKLGDELGTTLGNELESAVQDLADRAPTLNLEDSVNIYNWSWYIEPRMNAIFSDVTGCKVIYSTFETTDEVWARLSNPPSDYDVAVPSAPLQEYYDPEFGGPGAPYIEEIDHSLIPNIEHLFEMFQDPYYDPGLKHHVPYFWGTTGIGWNKEKIDEEDRRETLTGHQGINWAHIFPDNPLGEAFLEKYKKRVTMIPGSETICYAMKYLGYSINDIDDEAKVDEAVELMKLQKPYLLEYADASKYMTKLTAGTYYSSMVWSGDLYVVKAENPDLEFSIPAEKSDIWVDVAVIPKDPPHPNGAHAWMNWICDPAVSAINALATWYTPPVEASVDLLPESFQDPRILPPEEWWGFGADAKLEWWRPWTSQERETLAEKWQEIVTA